MVEQAQGSATARRMLVGARLRRLREGKGLSREDAGYAIRASESKMSRLELGRVAFKERDVADLLLLYGVTDPEERQQIVRLARQANDPGWWREYEDVVPGWFNNYVGLEEAAVGIRTYEIQFVPGLLQTEDYARAMIASSMPPPTTQELDRAVSLRMARQNILARDTPPSVWAVVDEAALRRRVGGPEVTRQQLKHLAELARLPHIALQVLPLTSQSHAAGGGAFTMLRFGEPELADVVYVEQLVSALYLDKPEYVDRYNEVMNRLSVGSLTPQETLDFLKAVNDAL
jgi:transcriptional regulator with XRE-family HTH domain